MSRLRVTAEDTPGGGLTMVITLPIKDGARRALPQLSADATT